MEIKAEVRELKYEELDEDYKRLIDEAERQMNQNAYAPYSGFSVGAAVLTEDGEVFGGANQEDASYTLTVHAEQAALAHSAAHGKRRIGAVAVIVKGTDKSGKPYEVETPTFPCGLCRQTTLEYAQDGSDIDVLASSTNKGVIYVAKARDLLPLAFGRNVLKK